MIKKYLFPYKCILVYWVIENYEKFKTIMKCPFKKKKIHILDKVKENFVFSDIIW